MSINKSRISKIEKGLKLKREMGYDQHSLIEGWRYGLFKTFTDADMYVFLHELENYCAKELESAGKAGKYDQIKQDLEETERRIRTGGGFMEIVFEGGFIPEGVGTPHN